jgi:hypothetical protein
VRFDVDERIGAPRGAVIVAFTDPTFYASLGAIPNIGAPVVLARDERDGIVHLRIQYRFTGDLPGPARRVLNPAKLTWVDHSAVDLDAGRIDFHIVPDHYPDRLEFAGTTTFVADGAARCRQHVAGDLRVHYPVVGRVVERAILSGIREHLTHEARVVERFVVPD